jgi:hypothetical protein
MIDIYGVNDDTDTPTSYTKIERFESECCLCVGCTLTNTSYIFFWLKTMPKIIFVQLNLQKCFK